MERRTEKRRKRSQITSPQKREDTESSTPRLSGTHGPHSSLKQRRSSDPCELHTKDACWCVFFPADGGWGRSEPTSRRRLELARVFSHLPSCYLGIRFRPAVAARYVSYVVLCANFIVRRRPPVFPLPAACLFCKMPNRDKIRRLSRQRFFSENIKAPICISTRH